MNDLRDSLRERCRSLSERPRDTHAPRTSRSEHGALLLRWCLAPSGIEVGKDDARPSAEHPPGREGTSLPVLTQVQATVRSSSGLDHSRH